MKGQANRVGQIDKITATDRHKQYRRKKVQNDSHVGSQWGLGQK